MLITIPSKWLFILLSLFLATLGGIYFYFYNPQNLGLVLLFFYIIPSNSFIPFPHEPAIIYYGKIFGPLLTTITAIIPTMIACVIDYAVLTPVFSRTKLSKLKESKIYQKTVYYFHKAPFFTNMFAAFSPVPFYPVRILSVASEYQLWKYTTAVVIGRVPRYYFLALFGMILNIPNWMIGIFFLSLGSAEIYRRLSKRRKKSVIEVLEPEVILESVESVENQPYTYSLSE
jgi:membrane protein YqaA with SNARE-associated domain